HGASQSLSRSDPRAVVSGTDDPAPPIARAGDPQRDLRRRPSVYAAWVHCAGLDRGRVAAGVGDAGHLQAGYAGSRPPREALMDQGALQNMAAGPAVEWVQADQVGG